MVLEWCIDCAADRSTSSPCSPSRMNVTKEARQSLGEKATPACALKADCTKRVHGVFSRAERRSAPWKRYSPGRNASSVTSAWMRVATASVTVMREGPKAAAAQRNE